MNDEQALIGAVLDGYRDLPALMRTVTAEDFYRPENGEIWKAICALHRDGIAPDPVLVVDRLGQYAHRMPGGPAYVVELHAPGPAVQAPRYAELVREGALKRQIKELAIRLGQISEDAEFKGAEALVRARKELDRLDQVQPSSRVSMWQAFEGVMKIIDEGVSPANPTPWSDLNHLLSGGLFPGQMVTIAARPSVGKSLMLENLATETARRGHHALYASLEMTYTELTQRTLAWTAKVELKKIITGQDLTDQDLERIAQAQQLITGTNLEIDDRPHQTVDDIRSAAWDVRQAARRQGSDLGLVVIDYLQLVTPPRDARNASRQQQLGEVSRQVKKLAKELGIPVAVGAQINRAAANRGGDGEPTMSDIREAGDIEQDSDVVILLHEETVDDGERKIATGDLRTIVAKNRQGPKGVLTLRKYGHHARLASATNIGGHS